MKLNGKENYIMLVSMGRHNIIFPWFFFLPFFCNPGPAQHPLCKSYPRAQPFPGAGCVCVCVFVYTSSSSSGLCVSKLLLSVDFLFIYFMPTHIRAKQFDRCRRLSGCLADQLTACLPARLPACLPACLLWELMVVWVPVWPCRGCGWSATRCEVAWSNSGKGKGRGERMKNVSLLFFVLFYAAFIRLFLLSFNRRGKVRQKQSNQQQQQHGGDWGYFTCLSRQPHPTRGHWERNEVILAAQ